ncbi:MAG: hypothetical protein E7667_03400 [Ruminococcaceae bacterium]|nr:hypothetical protein [Oscillospiraceae bacterium]
MKTLPIKLLLASLLLILIATMPIACSKKKKSGISVPTSQTTDSPTYLNGEKPTEKDSGNTQNDTSNPQNTQTPTEYPTEKPTEAPTETEPSLEYKSFGNGTCAVVGMGDISDLYVVIPEKSPEGDIVTTIDAAAFMGNNNITVVQIPSTVYSIGALAFADCNSLVHIAVDDANSHFCDIDGVLFDSKLTSLMAYPAGKTSSSLLLPATITSVADMALYGCDELKMIQFDGSVEEWTSVKIGDKNYGLYTAALSFLE